MICYSLLISILSDNEEDSHNLLGTLEKTLINELSMRINTK